MWSIRTQDLYKAVVTEVSGIASSWDVNFTVSTPPSRTNGFLVLSPDNALNRETVYFHNVIGSRIYVRWVNRKNPKAHSLNDLIQMNDVEEIFNYYADMTSPLFYVEKTGTLNVLVWGGTVLVNRTQVTVADTSLTLTDNATNYIVYDYLTNIISVNTTGVGLVKATAVVSSGTIASITYNIIKESYADPYVPDLALVAPEVQKQTWVYAAATGAVNTYAITLTPAVTAYAAGQKFTFKANLANTGTATLNVNGLGAKTIKKLWGTAILVSGDIAINQMVEVEYNGTDFDMQSPVANSTQSIDIAYIAWETISAWKPVYISSNWKVYLANLSTTFLWFSKSSWVLDGQIIVSISWIVISSSTLDIWSKYYLVTPWAIWNTWASKTSMTTARYLCASWVVNWKLYVIWWGWASTYLQTNEEYDPSLNTWSSKANMTTARYGCTAWVVNNKIYVIGWTNWSNLQTNEEYDPSLNTWSSKANMTTARQSCSAWVVNNKIYVIGWKSPLSWVNEEYDPSLNTWSSKTSMTTARYDSALWVVNNKIYVIWWHTTTYVQTNEEYDPSLNTWSSKANMTTAREAPFCWYTTNKIYVIWWLAWSIIWVNEEYDPSLNTWSSKTSMTTAREAWASWVINWKLYCIWWYIATYQSTNEEYYIPTAYVSWDISKDVTAMKVWVATSTNSILLQTNF